MILNHCFQTNVKIHYKEVIKYKKKIIIIKNK